MTEQSETTAGPQCVNGPICSTRGILPRVILSLKKPDVYADHLKLVFVLGE